LTTLESQENRLADQLSGFQDANHLLHQKTKKLESERSDMDAAVKLMDLELQELTGSEQSNIAKLRKIDSENRELANEVGSLANDRSLLRNETDGLKSELAQRASNEQLLADQIQELEADNLNLRGKLMNVRNSEDDFRRRIEGLVRKNDTLLSQLSLTKEQRIRLRNAIIGTIDDHDQRLD
jgi:chromosome segregation ATPase